MTIRTLYLHFDLPLFHRQIPQWRGAFAELAGVENDLFHNHKNELAFTLNHLSLSEVQEANASENGQWLIDNDPSSLGNGQWEMVNGKYHYRYPLIQ